jgi:hypothetical protein
MLRFLRRRSVRIALVAVTIPALLISIYGFYLADTAGMLPWQADPTRIPITPFADIPGFSVPTAAAPAPTQEGTPIPAETPPAAARTGGG